MTLTDPFADERLRFFLRNRDDIKTWAAIEPDVVAATRELLARSQPLVEEGLLAIDPVVLVGRRDNGPWERILARHDHWPASVGLTLEWHRSVDPSGTTCPKVGVFWWADPPTLEAPRTRLASVVNRKQLLGLGFQVLPEGVWPVVVHSAANRDWWREPEAWIGGLVDRLVAAWPLVAPHIDGLLPVESRVSDG